MGGFGFACLTYINITVFCLRRQICSIIDNLLAIYQSRKYFNRTIFIHKMWIKLSFAFIFSNLFFESKEKHSNLVRYSYRANALSEWLWVLYFKRLIPIMALSIFGAAMFSVLISRVIHGEFNVDNFFQISKMMWVTQTSGKKCKTKKIIQTILFATVYHGIKRQRLAISVKLHSLHFVAFGTFLRLAQWCCSTFQCVFIIRRFTKWLSIRWTNGINVRRTKTMWFSCALCDLIRFHATIKEWVK